MERIKQLTETHIIGTVMVPSFDKDEYNPDEKGKITFKAYKYGYFDSNYSVHEVLSNGENGRVLLENLKDSKFEYSFDLSKMESNKINLSMVFELNNTLINVPAKAEIKIKE
ncbi:hypothetical protein [Aestuariivivens marinum]|uniref:hypothetical protein n=1 Tax=Aestuariivivens marinum TaxID=2913555 RepID=UPI001F564297|nr:hypothetical protein [Aestuariivivens marinum]